MPPPDYPQNAIRITLHGSMFDESSFLTIEPVHPNHEIDPEDEETLWRMVNNNPERLFQLQKAGNEGLVLVPGE